MVACSHPRSEMVTDMNVICSRRALLAAICAPRAALTFAAPGAATVGTGSARGTGAPIVTIDSGSALAVVQRRLEGLSLESPQPELDSSFASTHHCSFWATG